MLPRSLTSQSLTIFMFLNLPSKSQPAKLAAGVPHELGSGLPFLIFQGTSLLAKYHTLMPELVHSDA